MSSTDQNDDDLCVPSIPIQRAHRTGTYDNDFVWDYKAGAAAEAVLDRDAFLEKPVFLVLFHWTHQLMLSSSREPPDSRPAGFEPR